MKIQESVDEFVEKVTRAFIGNLTISVLKMLQCLSVVGKALRPMQSLVNLPSPADCILL